MKRSLIIAALLAGGSQVSAVSANDLVLTEKAYKVQPGVQLAKKVRASNDSLPVERLLNSQIEAQDTKDRAAVFTRSIKFVLANNDPSTAIIVDRECVTLP